MPAKICSCEKGSPKTTTAARIEIMVEIPIKDAVRLTPIFAMANLIADSPEHCIPSLDKG